MFYFAGFFNLALGLYVLINGRGMFEPGTWVALIAFFFCFAAVDFWFPRVLRKKWREAQARLEAAGSPAQDAGKSDAGRSGAG